MLWAYNDSGYLIAADVPERGRCPMCGASYHRQIHDRKPWQEDVPDRCPSCGHVLNVIYGVAFENAAC